jgi:LuxR family transcriptional regulator
VSAPELSERQRDCLRLAAAGLEHGQIGARMYLAASTVTVHLRGARERLGASNTAHAVALGWHYGIVTAEHLELP